MKIDGMDDAMYKYFIEEMDEVTFFLIYIYILMHTLPSQPVCKIGSYMHQVLHNILYINADFL